MIDRNIFIGLAAGIVAGVVGYKIYEQNKESIDSRLKNLGICPQDQSKDTGSCQESSACSSMTLEELEAQKDYFTFDNYIILSDVEREIKRAHTYDEIEIYRIDIKK